MIKSAAYSTILLTALSGCFGGPQSFSNPNNPASFSSFDAVPANGFYKMTGTAVTADYTANLGAGTVAVKNVSGPKAAVITVTNLQGSTVAENIQTSGSTASFNTRTGDTMTTSGVVDTIVTADGQTKVVQINPVAAGYQYQSFGQWTTGLGSGSGTVGVASVGALTPTTGVPAPVQTTVNYSGTSIGFVQNPQGTPYTTTSTIGITTDFNAVTISSLNTQVTNVNTGVAIPRPEADFTGAGSVSGNGFTAAVNATPNGVFNGTANGTFYGPTAQEVGGTFHLSGTGGVYAGSFGAK